jgi:voltage-gated potassium channel
MLKRTRYKRFTRFAVDVVRHTPLLEMTLLLFAFWVLFSAGIYLAEQNTDNTTIRSYGDALYWGVAAFSTAGIADTPRSGISQVIGGIWIVLGSTLFFGTIVATITTYFSRPMKRPVRQIVDTIEYNLEQMDDLSIEELDLLKQTTNNLIEHMERLKVAQLEVGD